MRVLNGIFLPSVREGSPALGRGEWAFSRAALLLLGNLFLFFYPNYTIKPPGLLDRRFLISYQNLDKYLQKLSTALSNRYPRPRTVMI